MSKLMRASAWAKREFESGSEPDNRTIKKWVRNGVLQGRIVDGSVWSFQLSAGELAVLYQALFIILSMRLKC